MVGLGWGRSVCCHWSGGAAGRPCPGAAARPRLQSHPCDPWCCLWQHFLLRCLNHSSGCCSCYTWHICRQSKHYVKEGRCSDWTERKLSFYAQSNTRGAAALSVCRQINNELSALRQRGKVQWLNGKETEFLRPVKHERCCNTLCLQTNQQWVECTTSKREGAVTERKGNWVFTPSQTREVLQHSLSADKSTMSWEHGPDTCKRIIIQYPLFCKLNVFLDYNLFYIYKYDLVAKGLHRGGWGFWLPIKSVSNTLSCCFVCAFIIGQYHSGDNMSSKYGDAGATFIFESKKRHGIWPLKMDTLTVSAFDAFIHVHDESKLYLSHWFEQWRYCFTQCRCEQELFVYRFLH